MQKNIKKKPQKKVQEKSQAVVKTAKSSFLKHGKHFLQKTDWNKVVSMKGDIRRSVLSSIFQSGQYSDEQIATLMAQEYHLQKINFSEFEIDSQILSKVPRRICEKYQLIPVIEVEGTIVIAFSDPGDIQAKDDVSLITNSKIKMMVGARSDIQKMINIYYKNENSKNIQNIFSIVDSATVENLQEDDSLSNQKIKHDPTVQSVEYIIQEGIRLNCSDIHIEVYEKQCRVRFRVDGHLAEYIHPPLSLKDSISSRIKILSRLDISEKRLPQDGRLTVKVNHKTVSFRVSTVPVVNGEKIVLRILDTSALGTELVDLGMNQNQLAIFKKYLNVSQGLILMTGPTGSGKTTTIYSGLQTLNTPNRNISTVEDPVEYKLHGINQVQVNTNIGLTFSSVLRSFLRQDPDVILLGEIRDLETANIAYRAAATGHLVLSTLHTNDAASTVTRLLDIGLPAYSVVENTSVVIAQRLLRVLCKKCKVSHSVNMDILKNLGFTDKEAESARPKIMKSEGCKNCNNSGYKGRVAVFEVMEISHELKAGIFKGLSPRELKQLAIQKNNLQTLRRSGLEKLMNGITSIDEVIYGTLGDH